MIIEIKSKSQITIPKEIMQELKIEKGTKEIVEQNNN